jgi:hypothetical protein
MYFILLITDQMYKHSKNMKGKLSSLSMMPRASSVVFGLVHQSSDKSLLGTGKSLKPMIVLRCHCWDHQKERSNVDMEGWLWLIR